MKQFKAEMFILAPQQRPTLRNFPENISKSHQNMEHLKCYSTQSRN